MSLVLIKKFGDALRALDYSLEVEIADDRTVSAPRAHRVCVLELFCEKYLIDLAPIPLRGMQIIMGMNWLS